jgi:hypothetical protein
MRALVLFFILSSTYALAAPPSATIRSSVKNESGSTGLTNTNSSSSATMVTSLDADSGSYLNGASLRFGVDRSKSDYRRYVLTDRAGTQSDLSQQFSAAEHTLRLGSSLYLKQTSLALDAAKTAGPTPFPGGSLTGTLSQEFLTSGSKLAITVLHSDHQSPSSYYIDPDTFSTKLRPKRLLENRGQFSVEQILSEKTKLRLAVFLADKPESRPLERGGEFGLAHALGDSSALVGTLGLAREKKSDLLPDDRGYLGASWADLEFRLQPTYHIDLSAKIGTILETETARGRLPQHKVGTDTLGLSGKYRGSFGEAGLTALGARSNTGYQALSFGGTFTCTL